MSEETKTPKKDETPDKIVGESMRLQDVENFFKRAINPGLIEAKIEKTTAALMKERGGLNTGLIIALAIVLVAGAVAYSMISNNSKQNEWVNKYTACNANYEQLKASCSQKVVTPQNPDLIG